MSDWLDVLEPGDRDALARSRKTCPYATPPDDAGDDVHWVSPQLVAEVGFAEWTDDGRLRHPRSVGLRDDKKASAVRREEPR